jgi:hypothetical protein
VVIEITYLTEVLKRMKIKRIENRGWRNKGKKLKMVWRTGC